LSLLKISADTRQPKRETQFFSAYHRKFEKASKVGERAQKTLGSAVRCESGWRQMRQPFLPLKIDLVDLCQLYRLCSYFGHITTFAL